MWWLALPQPAAPGFRIHLRPLRQGRRWPPLPSRGGAVWYDFCGFHGEEKFEERTKIIRSLKSFQLIFDESILCMYMQYIHQLMDWNFWNSCPSMLMNVHHLLYLHRSQKISFTILAADRIFKVVMNMVVKSSPHQKSPEALFVCFSACPETWWLMSMNMSARARSNSLARKSLTYICAVPKIYSFDSWWFLCLWCDPHVMTCFLMIFLSNHFANVHDYKTLQNFTLLIAWVPAGGHVTSFSIVYISYIFVIHLCDSLVFTCLTSCVSRADDVLDHIMRVPGPQQPPPLTAEGD